jgi:hypothetical protein
MNRRIPFLFTIDIHSRKKHNNSLEEELNVCLDELNRANIIATFFLPGILIDECGTTVLQQLVSEGHQLACHGLLHKSPENFLNDSLDKQIDYLKRAKEKIEAVSEVEVTAFRAPGFIISSNTMIALEQCGYKADLSVNSQRLSILSSQIGNFHWLIAPRVPYHPSSTNPYCPGDLSIWEIPTTALVVPFTSMLYQALGASFTRMFARIMIKEARSMHNKPVVYMCHPEEFYPSNHIRPKWKLSWRLFAPRKNRGFQIRQLLYERDEYQIHLRTMEMMRFFGECEQLEYLTVDQYLTRIEGSEIFIGQRK